MRVVLPVKPRGLWLPPHRKGVGLLEAGDDACGLKLRGEMKGLENDKAR